jgi:hypothetical protein
MGVHGKTDEKIKEVSRKEHQPKRDGGSDVVLVESHKDPPVAAEARGTESGHTNGEESKLSTISLNGIAYGSEDGKIHNQTIENTSEESLRKN